MLLVGEAGIGKSRITKALLDAVAEEPHIRIRYQCSPYHTDSALLAGDPAAHHGRRIHRSRRFVAGQTGQAGGAAGAGGR